MVQYENIRLHQLEYHRFGSCCCHRREYYRSVQRLRQSILTTLLIAGAVEL